MSVVENEIQKLKSLLDQCAKGMQAIDSKAAGGFELQSTKQRIEKLRAELRQKETEIGMAKKQAEAPDLNKLDTQRKNFEVEKKRLEEQIRQTADDSIKSHDQLQNDINKSKAELESLKAEAARLTARIQGARNAQVRAEKEMPKIIVAIEKAEREAQLKNKQRLDKKATKEMEARLAREKKLQGEAEKRLREAAAARKKQEEERVKKSAARSQADLVGPDKETDKRELLKRKQRAEKRLRSLQDEAHRKDPGEIRRRRLQQLKGVAQRGGMSAKQKKEYERLKSQDVKSQAN